MYGITSNTEVFIARSFYSLFDRKENKKKKKTDRYPRSSRDFELIVDARDLVVVIRDGAEAYSVRLFESNYVQLLRKTLVV